MEFLFFGGNVKQNTIFETETNPSAIRLKAFRFMLEEIDKTRGPLQEKLKEKFKHKWLMAFNVLVKTLKG